MHSLESRAPAYRVRTSRAQVSTTVGGRAKTIDYRRRPMSEWTAFIRRGHRLHARSAVAFPFARGLVAQAPFPRAPWQADPRAAVHGLQRALSRPYGASSATGPPWICPYLFLFYFKGGPRQRT